MASPRAALDGSGFVLVCVGTGCQILGWADIWTYGPSGFRMVAFGAGVVAAGLVLLAGSWLIEHRQR